MGDWGAGATPLRSNSAFYGGGIPWYKSGELPDGPLNDSEETVTELALQKCSLRLNKPGDVVVAMYGATIGRTGILTRESTSNQAVCACTCMPQVFNRFLLVVLRAYRRRFVAQGEGGAQPNISKVKIVAMPVALPPLAEQKRIVEKVDQLMALCDELEAAQKQKREKAVAFNRAALNAVVHASDKAALASSWSRLQDHFEVLYELPENVKQLRQTILQLAVMGKLGNVPKGRVDEPTAPWLLPSGWRWVALAEVAESRLGKMLDNEKNKGQLRPYLRNTNVHWFTFDLTSLKEMRIGNDELSELTLSDGDVMVCEGGHGVGRSAVWRGNVSGLVFQKALHRVRPNPELNGTYLVYCIKDAFDSGRLQNLFTGAGIPHLTGKALARFRFPLPPLQQQLSIVDQVESLMAYCSKLDAEIAKAGTSGMRLMQAAVESLTV